MSMGIWIDGGLALIKENRLFESLLAKIYDNMELSYPARILQLTGCPRLWYVTSDSMKRDR